MIGDKNNRPSHAPIKSTDRLRKNRGPSSEIHSSVRKGRDCNRASFSEMTVLSSEAGFKGDSDEGVRELIGANSPGEQAVRLRSSGVVLPIGCSNNRNKSQENQFTSLSLAELIGP